MEILDIPCKRDNYGGLRAGSVEYLVVHYTAGHNDTAENNGAYFARETVGASAHFFVDGSAVVRSVPEDHVAWHCGGSAYRHPACRNSNSIGVEICSRYENGVYSFDPAALERARELLMWLMDRYKLGRDRVLRHFDVTGKLCPAPFVGEGQTAWLRFREGLDPLDGIPLWARATVEKLADRGVLRGDETGSFDLSRDLLRVLVILDRLGLIKEKEEEHE